MLWEIWVGGSDRSTECKHPSSTCTSRIAATLFFFARVQEIRTTAKSPRSQKQESSPEEKGLATEALPAVGHTLCQPTALLLQAPTECPTWAEDGSLSTSTSQPHWGCSTTFKPALKTELKTYKKIPQSCAGPQRASHVPPKQSTEEPCPSHLHTPPKASSTSGLRDCKEWARIPGAPMSVSQQSKPQLLRSWMVASTSKGAVSAKKGKVLLAHGRLKQLQTQLFSHHCTGRS